MKRAIALLSGAGHALRGAMFVVSPLKAVGSNADPTPVTLDTPEAPRGGTCDDVIMPTNAGGVTQWLRRSPDDRTGRGGLRDSAGSDGAADAVNTAEAGTDGASELAATGASVGGVAVLAALLVASGGVFMWLRRRRSRF